MQHIPAVSEGREVLTDAVGVLGTVSILVLAASPGLSTLLLPIVSATLSECVS